MSNALTPTRRWALLAATAGVLIPIYAWVGVHTARAGVPMHQVHTVLDTLVPFEAGWVFIYAFVFLQATAPVAVITDERVLIRTVGAYAALYAVGTPMWILYPVGVPRPPVPIVDLWTYGVGLVRFVDPPGNCMPSMHVALAVVAALVVYRHDRKVGLGLGVAAGLIWWSTVAIRQHYATDGLVGGLLAIVADKLAFDVRPLPASAFLPLPRAWHATWLLAFAVAVTVLMSGWWFGWVPVDQLPPNANNW